ncbi:hypothetical protein C8J57DRAFT_1220437 [Mycena rebaudengoi]|nr:hypothetical protein C8J57DRAFT_1220437 [Mycena rebaudengoi]
MRARRGTWRARPARNSVTRSAVDKGPTAARRRRIYGDPALRNPNSAQQKKTENIANFGCRALKLWIARRHNAQWAIPGLRSSFSHMLVSMRREMLTVDIDDDLEEDRGRRKWEGWQSSTNANEEATE